MTKWFKDVIELVNLTPSRLLRAVLILGILALAHDGHLKDQELKAARESDRVYCDNQIKKLQARIDDGIITRRIYEKQCDSMAKAHIAELRDLFYLTDKKYREFEAYKQKQKEILNELK